MSEMKTLKAAIDSLELISARNALKHQRERNSLIVLYMHGLYQNQKEINAARIDPLSNRGMTISYLRQLIDYFLCMNYDFVSPEDIIRGLANNKYIMLTFDDGYFNNMLSLPVLKEYRVPAVFFISAGHVQDGKAFWWDVLYRERRKSGISEKKISSEMENMKARTNEEIVRYLASRFGEEALRPLGDIDRPFRPMELSEFAKESLVHLGNHTRDHAILTNYSTAGIRAQIMEAQRIISEITDIVPNCISYPNGMYSSEVIKIVGECGLSLGFTIESEKNYLPQCMRGDGPLRLARFPVRGDSTLQRQCEMARSDLHIYGRMKKLFLSHC